MCVLQLEEVLPEAYARSLETVELYAMRIPRKVCSQALRCPSAWLRENYPHLKRIKAFSAEKVFEDSEQSSVCLLLGELGVISSELLSLTSNPEPPFLVSVPKHCPFTKEQAAEWNKVWPVTYRQPAWRPMQFLKENDVKERILFVLKTISQRNADCQNAICSSVCFLALGDKIIVDTDLGGDMLEEERQDVMHPLYHLHAPLVALHQLSAYVLSLQQRETDESLIQTHPTNRERTGRRICLITTAEMDQPSIPLLRESIRTGSSELPHKTKLRLRNSQENRSLPVPISPFSDDCFLSSKEVTSGQYYAQGFVAFLSKEPCVMCSMALVHSRVECVVMPRSASVERFGGFTVPFSVHSDKKLNHNFHVLRAG